MKKEDAMDYYDFGETVSIEDAAPDVKELLEKIQTEDSEVQKSMIVKLPSEILAEQERVVVIKKPTELLKAKYRSRKRGKGGKYIYDYGKKGHHSADDRERHSEEEYDRKVTAGNRSKGDPQSKKDTVRDKYPLSSFKSSKKSGGAKHAEYDKFVAWSAETGGTPSQWRKQNSSDSYQSQQSFERAVETEFSQSDFNTYISSEHNKGDRQILRDEFIEWAGKNRDRVDVEGSIQKWRKEVYLKKEPETKGTVADHTAQYKKDLAAGKYD